MKVHKCDYKEAFLRWFPEVTPKMFTNFRVRSITVVVENLEVKGLTKFQYKKEK
jgi:hypothetical protein